MKSNHPDQSALSDSRLFKRLVNISWWTLVLGFIGGVISLSLYGVDYFHASQWAAFSFLAQILFQLIKLFIVSILTVGALKNKLTSYYLLVLIMFIEVATSIIMIINFNSPSIVLKAVVCLWTLALAMSFIGIIWGGRFFKYWTPKNNFEGLYSAVGDTNFIISAIIAYAGAVNLGATGFILAIPFYIFLAILSSDVKYGFKSKVVLGVCACLIVLKYMPLPVFYPANGREVILLQDACVAKTTDERSNSSKISFHFFEPNCTGTLQENIEALGLVKKGMKFKVVGTVTETPFLMEHYRLQLDTLYGVITNSDSDFNFIRWGDGKKIYKEDLYRDIFYQPSRLFWLPLLPIDLFFRLSGN